MDLFFSYTLKLLCVSITYNSCMNYIIMLVKVWWVVHKNHVHHVVFLAIFGRSKTAQQISDILLHSFKFTVTLNILQMHLSHICIQYGALTSYKCCYVTWLLFQYFFCPRLHFGISLLLLTGLHLSLWPLWPDCMICESTYCCQVFVRAVWHHSVDFYN